MPIFTLVFVIAFLASITTRLWLITRQIRCVSTHRAQVPSQFLEKISLASHQHAADYTLANMRLGILATLIEALLLVTFTFLGGIEWLNKTLQIQVGNGLMYGLVLIFSITLISSLVDLPVSIYKQFHIEEKFGFNRMTAKLFITDLIRTLIIGLIIGIPLLSAVLWLMESTGGNWWLWTWLLWTSFSLLMLVLGPTVIMPLYNRFTPLEDQTLYTRIEALLTRCGFKSKGVFVMDGSKRSSHGNAYFTGFGSAKRIVFFDTLIEKLTPDEIEAVLAHELGHFHHRHIVKRITVSILFSFALLALLGYLIQQPWFYTDLGITPNLESNNNALALVLFFLILPVFSFFISPLANLSSRKHEFQADEFAAKQTSAPHLISALVKLYQDNAATLTPDPLYTKFHASHPPANQRITQLENLAK